MKKIVSFLLFALLFANFSFGQSTEALSNATIVKMVKAKLSDDLIIDEINSSKVNFDLSAAGMNALTNEKVSDKVLKAMKAAYIAQTPPDTIKNVSPVIIPATDAVSETKPEVPAKPTIDKPKETLNQPIPQNTGIKEQATVTPQPQAQVKKEIKQPEPKPTISQSLPSEDLSAETTRSENGTLVIIRKPAFTINANSYVIPAKDLVTYYNNEFSTMAGFVQDWDKKLRISLQKEINVKAEISSIEDELTAMKNADARPFSKDILDLKKKLVASWDKHKTIKTEMAAEGKKLVADLEKTSKETSGSMAAKYKEVSKNVKSSHPDPAAGETATPINIPEQKFNQKITDFFAPASMVLVCYQNEIKALQQTLSNWNEKTIVSFQKDTELRQQLEPLQNEMTQYLATSKQEQKLKKKDIAALKKQIDNNEKERKLLARQMQSDSENFSSELDKMGEEAQTVIKERFADIIENIEHTYQDRFNL